MRRGTIKRRLSRWPLTILAVMLTFATIVPLSRPLVPVHAAATGDLTGTANFSTDCSSGIGVGITFDGTNLWYSCAVNGATDLLRADPRTGAVSASYSIGGGNGLGALAYDATHNLIYAGWGSFGNAGNVYAVYLDATKSVTNYTVAFSTGPEALVCDLDDGLAYDGSNNTLYISDDCSTTIHHYDTVGNHLKDGPNGTGDFVWAGSGCYNSGLALGNQLIFEGSDGCNQVVVVDKAAPATVKFQFSTVVPGDPNFRDEGLTCDTSTFPGVQVMWSKEAYSPMRAHAFAIPPGSCGVGGQPAPGKRPLIFIPGIAGSELKAVTDSPAGGRRFVDSGGNTKAESYTKDQVIWLDGDKLQPLPRFNDQEFFDLLRFNPKGTPLFDDFAPDSNFVSTTVDFREVAPYGNVIQTMKDAGYAPGEDFFVFAYDWRYSAEHSRQMLDDLITQVVLPRNPDATSIDVVAHSMGTMVTRDYLLNGANRDKIHQTVMLAPPNFGTVKGALALLDGVCLPDDYFALANCFIGKRTLKYIFDTLPGGVDQAPSPAYISSVYDGHDDAHPVPFIDRTVRPAETSWHALASAEIAAGVTPAALDVATAFHQSEDNWYQRVTTPVVIMAGTGVCTPGQIIQQPGFSLPLIGQIVAPQLDVRAIDGDGTVPRRSASLDDRRLAPGVKVYWRNFNHNDMGNSPSVLKDAVDILNGAANVQIGSIGRPPSPHRGDCHLVSVHSPMEMLVTDSQGNRLGDLDGSSTYREIPDANFMHFGDLKEASIGGDGVYHVSLKGTAAGEATIRMRVIGTDSTLLAYVFNHVPVTAASTGSLTLDTSNSTVSNLTIDPDGTGRHLRIYAPTLVGADADDTTPPDLSVTAPRPGQAVVGQFRLNWTATDAQTGVSQTFGYLDAGSSSARRVDQPQVLELPAGGHTFDVYAEDKLENGATAHVNFNAYAYRWRPPMSSLGITSNGQRTIPVMFDVTGPDGHFVNDASCAVSVVDASGHAYFSQPCAVHDQLYQVSISTDSIPSGKFSIVVNFNSDKLIGSFSAPLVNTR